MAAITKTSQIIEKLGQRLRNGEWLRDAPLPSVASLSEEYDVSPGTVALALKSLERDGLVKVLPRQGVLATGSTLGGNDQTTPMIGLYGSYGNDAGKGYMSVVTRRILDAAHRVGGAVLMLPRLPKGEPLTPEHCRGHGVKGVIFLGGHHRENVAALCDVGFPAITANMPADPTPINFCSYGYRGLLLEATSRFLALGHRKIAFLSAETSTLRLLEVCKPDVLQHLCDEGCLYNINPYWRNMGVVEPEELRPKVFEAMDAFFSLPERPTAIFCRATTDLMPVFLEWAEVRGVKIPETLSVIAAAYPEDEILTSGFLLQHERLGNSLVESLYKIIKNPFLRVQETISLPFVDIGTVGPPCSQ